MTLAATIAPAPVPATRPHPQWPRQQTADHLRDFEVAAAARGSSQRSWARSRKVPRTSLQSWLYRKRGLEGSPETVAFLESPAGLAFIHRLMTTLFLVFSELGPSGRRRVGLALRLAGLSPFVGLSDGSLHKLGTSLQDQIVAYEELHRPLLAAGMEPKQITLCEDETFHPQICLVAIEPVSNFIVLEKYAKKRDGPTWTAELKGALQGLPVRVIQSTSDEGSGLLAHVEKDLGAHHSPDIFHCQHEVSRGLSIALAAQVRQAGQAIADVVAHKEGLRKNEQEWRETGGTIAPDFAPRFAKAESDQRQAECALEVARARQERAREAIRGIGDDYHPVDLQTGAIREPAEVGKRLELRFEAASALAREASLSDRCHKSIAKARRLLPAFVTTLVFFSLETASRLAALGLTPEQLQVVATYLVPLAYLERALRKGRDAATRQQLRDLIARLSASPPALASTLALLPAEHQLLLAKVIADCADLFQRASSCTEGRNGQLALYHHGLHALSDRKLRVLTILHNYFITRSDGTTAAKRFYGKRPPDLFGWVLERVTMPARPRRNVRPEHVEQRAA